MSLRGRPLRVIQLVNESGEYTAVVARHKAVVGRNLEYLCDVVHNVRWVTDF